MELTAKIIVVQDAETLELMEVFGSQLDFDLWYDGLEENSDISIDDILIEKRSVPITLNIKLGVSS